jgi:hypothetical protein
LATSFPVTLPAVAIHRGATNPRRIHFQQVSAVAVGQSPYTLSQQVQRRQGQVWRVDVEYPPIANRATAEALHAALCSLNGREGTFIFGDTAGTTALGAGGGTPLVKGGGQTGEDLLTDGWPNNTIYVLYAGTWVQIGTGSTARLYKVLNDVASNGSGEATLTLWPRIFTAWADNAALTFTSPKGVFRLITDGHAWDIDEMQIHGCRFSAQSLP